MHPSFRCPARRGGCSPPLRCPSRRARSDTSFEQGMFPSSDKASFGGRSLPPFEEGTPELGGGHAPVLQRGDVPVLYRGVLRGGHAPVVRQQMKTTTAAMNKNIRCRTVKAPHVNTPQHATMMALGGNARLYPLRRTSPPPLAVPTVSSRGGLPE